MNVSLTTWNKRQTNPKAVTSKRESLSTSLHFSVQKIARNKANLCYCTYVTPAENYTRATKFPNTYDPYLNWFHHSLSTSDLWHEKVHVHPPHPIGYTAKTATWPYHHVKNQKFVTYFIVLFHILYLPPEKMLDEKCFSKKFWKKEIEITLWRTPFFFEIQVFKKRFL